MGSASMVAPRVRFADSGERSAVLRLRPALSLRAEPALSKAEGRRSGRRMADD